MQISLEAAKNGILAQVQRQDLIANHLANINTTGFKKSRQALGDFLVPGTHDISTPLDMRQGDLVRTGKDTDLAIGGDGFFAVLKGGVPAYTRAGNFSVDRDGNLVTSSGVLVEPAITFPPETEGKEVLPDGSVFAVTDGGRTVVQVGRLEVTRFANPTGLLPIGDNLYLEGPDSGPAITGNFGDTGFPVLQHRYLEDSNVDLTEEITEQVATQRAFQANMRAYRSADEAIGEALDLFR